MLWCDRFNIAKLRRVPQYDWRLLEQHEAEFSALPEEDRLTDLGAPKPHVQHLFSKKPSKYKQDRINQLAAALDEYTAACDALIAELGIPEADDVTEKLWDEIFEIAHPMKSIEPTTIQGLQAKAKIPGTGIGPARRRGRMPDSGGNHQEPSARPIGRLIDKLRMLYRPAGSRRRAFLLPPGLPPDA
jgi:hypothetical protein